MNLDLSKLPENARLEVTKSDLIAFAKEVIKESKISPAEPTQPKEDILNFNEMCKFLGIAKPTGYAKTSNGELPLFKKGGKLYFKKSELITWIETGRRKTQKEIDQLADDYLKSNKPS